jgi:hypothetical protein
MKIFIGVLTVCILGFLGINFFLREGEEFGLLDKEKSLDVRNIDDFIEETNNSQELNDKEKISNIFLLNMRANAGCDNSARNKVIASDSISLISKGSSCSKMKREAECNPQEDYEIEINGDKAVLYYLPYGHSGSNPYFFLLEDGSWKIDYLKMSKTISMVGSGCSSGWSWRSDGKSYFCSMFLGKNCPE